MHFRKSHVRAHELDVQETGASPTQLDGSRNHFFDAGLRMDGIPALELWDLVIEVLHSSRNSMQRRKEPAQADLLHNTSRPRTLSPSSKDLGLISSTGRLVARDSNQNDAASSSQVWQTNAETTSAGRTTAREATQDTDLSTSTWKRAAGDPKNVDTNSEWQIDYQISAASQLHREKVFSCLRQKMGRETLDDLDTNSLIWGFFSTTLEAAIQLGTAGSDFSAIIQRMSKFDPQSDGNHRIDEH